MTLAADESPSSSPRASPLPLYSTFQLGYVSTTCLSLHASHRDLHWSQKRDANLQVWQSGFIQPREVTECVAGGLKRFGGTKIPMSVSADATI